MQSFDEIYKEIESEAIEKVHKDFFSDFKKEKNRELILYGAGNNCDEVISTCNINIPNVNITCICDSNKTGIYKYKEQEYRIISNEELIQNYKDAFVLITTWEYEEEIRRSLIARGFLDSQIYYFRYTRIMISPQTFRDKYLEGYKWAYNFFEDDSSKQKIINKIKLLLLNVPCPKDSSYDDGYFAFPNLNLENDEVFIDGGAYTGDTAEEFVKAMSLNNKNYKYIYSFEPDLDNYKIATTNLSLYKNVEVVPYGLWNKKTDLYLKVEEWGEGASSHILENNNDNVISVPVTSLDTFFKDSPKDEWPTLIKMDIEGSEKEALIGATEIIKTKKPKLIICAYHKPEDIYELPQTIMRIRSDYKMALWQIGTSFWDCVLYMY